MTPCHHSRLSSWIVCVGNVPDLARFGCTWCSEAGAGEDSSVFVRGSEGADAFDDEANGRSGRIDGLASMVVSNRSREGFGAGIADR